MTRWVARADGGHPPVRAVLGRRPPPGDDTGAGAALVLAVAAVVVVLAAALGMLAQAQHARSQAQAGADLAALAAAGTTVLPPGVRVAVPQDGAGACALASQVAERNGAALVRCAVGDHGVVEVETARATAWGAARATARAGPAWVRGP